MATSSKVARPGTAAKKKAATVKKKAPAKKHAPKHGKAAARNAAPARKASGGGDGYSRAAMQAAKLAEKPIAGASEQPLMKALRAEHRHMATVMQLFLDQLKALEGGQVVDAHVLYEVMDYMVQWPDRYHHPREDLIYSRVAELDSRASDDVDTLQRDHDRTAKNGKQLLRDIRAWRDGALPAGKLVKAGRAYIDHLYEHMNVEEKVVFPRIEAVLTLEDWRELAEDDQLEAVALPVVGPQVQREFRALARRLRRRVRRSVERGAMSEWIGIEAFMESLEVLSLAYDSARSSTGEHLRTAVDEAREMFQESPITAPVLCALNNTRLGLAFARDVFAISRDTVEDLIQVNRDRRHRLGRLDR